MVYSSGYANSVYGKNCYGIRPESAFNLSNTETVYLSDNIGVITQINQGITEYFSIYDNIIIALTIQDVNIIQLNVYDAFINHILEFDPREILEIENESRDSKLAKENRVKETALYNSPATKPENRNLINDGEQRTNKVNGENRIF